ncbi:HAD family phosphatase [Streptomyces albidoflavus]|uniref:HAD family hydrolase n=1 Tax=Streptomyces albidoflavus TaxID=1886 RepID=UPI0033A8F9BB
MANVTEAALPAVVFDLDGTLVDSEPNYFEAGRALLEAHGVPGFTWADHERYIGVSTRETLADWRRRYGLGASLDALVEELDDRYLALARAGTPVFEQMALLVERLHRAGVPMAVASGSSGSAITAVLTGTGLDDLLGPAVSAEEVPRGKPAPDVFLEAARRLGAAPVDCVVIEDAEPGVAAALAARMRCVAVPSVPAAADDPVFSAAGLLFPDGQPSFRAAETYDWIMRVPG